MALKTQPIINQQLFIKKVMELFVFNGPCTAKNASCFMKIKLLSKILKISDCGNQMALEMIRMNKSAICILMHFTSGTF